MLNVTVIQGRFVADPQLKTTQSQTPFTTFTIACERDYGDRQADFFNCTAWRGTAEFICKHFKKGQMALFSGRLQNRVWKDKDGNNRNANDIEVDMVYFCGSKRQEFVEITDDEDVPF